jgi:hypothetical protein
MLQNWNDIITMLLSTNYIIVTIYGPFSRALTGLNSYSRGGRIGGTGIIINLRVIL